MTRYEKSVSNIKEVKARDGIVISVVTEGDQLAREASDHIIVVPPTIEMLAPYYPSDPVATAGLPRICRGAAAATWISRATSPSP